MAHHHASPIQLRTGEWGARVPAPNVEVGDGLTVITRSGSAWEATVTSVVWQGADAAICEAAKARLAVGPIRCKKCGEVGHKGGCPFST